MRAKSRIRMRGGEGDVVGLVRSGGRRRRMDV